MLERVNRRGYHTLLSARKITGEGASFKVGQGLF